MDRSPHAASGSSGRLASVPRAPRGNRPERGTRPSPGTLARRMGKPARGLAASSSGSAASSTVTLSGLSGPRNIEDPRLALRRAALGHTSASSSRASVQQRRSLAQQAETFHQSLVNLQSLWNPLTDFAADADVGDGDGSSDGNDYDRSISCSSSNRPDLLAATAVVAATNDDTVAENEAPTHILAPSGASMGTLSKALATTSASTSGDAGAKPGIAGLAVSVSRAMNESEAQAFVTSHSVDTAMAAAEQKDSERQEQLRKMQEANNALDEINKRVSDTLRNYDEGENNSEAMVRLLGDDERMTGRLDTETLLKNSRDTVEGIVDTYASAMAERQELLQDLERWFTESNRAAEQQYQTANDAIEEMDTQLDSILADTEENRRRLLAVHVHLKDKAQAQLDAARAEPKADPAAIAALQADLASERQSNATLADALEDAQRRAKEVENKMNMLGKTMKRKQDELAAVKKTETLEVSRLKLEMDARASTWAERETSLQRTIDRLQSDLEATKEPMNKLTQDLSKAAARNTKLERDLQAVNTRLNTRETESRRRENAFESQIRTLRADIAAKDKAASKARNALQEEMKTGFDKQLAQERADFDRQLLTQQQKMLKELRKAEREMQLAQTSQLARIEKLANANAPDTARLIEELRNSWHKQYTAMRKSAEEELQSVRGFHHKREAAAQLDHDAKIKMMERKHTAAMEALRISLDDEFRKKYRSLSQKYAEEKERRGRGHHHSHQGGGDGGGGDSDNDGDEDEEDGDGMTEEMLEMIAEKDDRISSLSEMLLERERTIKNLEAQVREALGIKDELPVVAAIQGEARRTKRSMSNANLRRRRGDSTAGASGGGDGHNVFAGSSEPKEIDLTLRTLRAEYRLEREMAESQLRSQLLSEKQTQMEEQRERMNRERQAMFEAARTKFQLSLRTNVAAAKLEVFNEVDVLKNEVHQLRKQASEIETLALRRVQALEESHSKTRAKLTQQLERLQAALAGRGTYTAGGGAEQEELSELFDRVDTLESRNINLMDELAKKDAELQHAETQISRRFKGKEAEARQAAVTDMERMIADLQEELNEIREHEEARQKKMQDELVAVRHALVMEKDRVLRIDREAAALRQARTALESRIEFMEAAAIQAAQRVTDITGSTGNLAQAIEAAGTGDGSEPVRSNSPELRAIVQTQNFWKDEAKRLEAKLDETCRELHIANGKVAGLHAEMAQLTTDLRRSQNQQNTQVIQVERKRLERKVAILQKALAQATTSQHGTVGIQGAVGGLAAPLAVADAGDMSPQQVAVAATQHMTTLHAMIDQLMNVMWQRPLVADDEFPKGVDSSVGVGSTLGELFHQDRLILDQLIHVTRRFMRDKQTNASMDKLKKTNEDLSKMLSDTEKRLDMMREMYREQANPVRRRGKASKPSTGITHSDSTVQLGVALKKEAVRIVDQDSALRQRRVRAMYMRMQLQTRIKTVQQSSVHLSGRAYLLARLQERRLRAKLLRWEAERMSAAEGRVANLGAVLSQFQEVKARAVARGDAYPLVPGDTVMLSAEELGGLGIGSDVLPSQMARKGGAIRGELRKGRIRGMIGDASAAPVRRNSLIRVASSRSLISSSSSTSSSKGTGSVNAVVGTVSAGSGGGDDAASHAALLPPLPKGSVSEAGGTTTTSTVLHHPSPVRSPARSPVPIPPASKAPPVPGRHA